MLSGRAAPVSFECRAEDILRFVPDCWRDRSGLLSCHQRLGHLCIGARLHEREDVGERVYRSLRKLRFFRRYSIDRSGLAPYSRLWRLNTHIFVTGGSEQTGAAIVSGTHRPSPYANGLSSSEKSIARLTGLGARTLLGSLGDLEVLAGGARAADGVIHMAFGGDFSDPASMTRRDCAAIKRMGASLTGSGKPLVITSGTLVMTTGKVATERDAPDPQSLATLKTR